MSPTYSLRLLVIISLLVPGFDSALQTFFVSVKAFAVTAFAYLYLITWNIIYQTYQTSLGVLLKIEYTGYIPWLLNPCWRKTEKKTAARLLTMPDKQICLVQRNISPARAISVLRYNKHLHVDIHFSCMIFLKTYSAWKWWWYQQNTLPL